jgi:hypothetical protein
VQSDESKPLLAFRALAVVVFFSPTTDAWPLSSFIHQVA